MQTLKEQIEQMDVNLIRYNVKKESEEFISQIKSFSKEESPHTIVKITEPTESKKGKPSKKKGFSCCLKVIFLDHLFLNLTLKFY